MAPGFLLQQFAKHRHRQKKTRRIVWPSLSEQDINKTVSLVERDSQRDRTRERERQSAAAHIVRRCDYRKLAMFHCSAWQCIRLCVTRLEIYIHTMKYTYRLHARLCHFWYATVATVGPLDSRRHPNAIHLVMLCERATFHPELCIRIQLMRTLMEMHRMPCGAA